MPYHIKKTSILGAAVPENGSEYYTENDSWTNIYSDRKIYANKADADAQKATSITRTLGGKSYTYQPKWWKNSTVIEE